MKQNLFCVFDSAAHRYLDPFVAPTAEVAMRGFGHAVNQENHQFNQFPEDYTLFHIGSFDPESGQLEPETPRSLGNALTFKKPSPQLSLIDDNASISNLRKAIQED